MSAATESSALVERLRELSLVRVEALLAGVSDEGREGMLSAFAEDLEDALAAARRRAEELRQRIARGPDPLAFLDAPGEARLAEGGRKAAGLARQRAASRAEACRELAQLDAAVARVAECLAALERLRARHP